MIFEQTQHDLAIGMSQYNINYIRVILREGSPHDVETSHMTSSYLVL